MPQLLMCGQTAKCLADPNCCYTDTKRTTLFVPPEVAAVQTQHVLLCMSPTPITSVLCTKYARPMHGVRCQLS
jgi:hypothetical protein